jgi:hypothetical protein
LVGADARTTPVVLIASMLLPLGVACWIRFAH